MPWTGRVENDPPLRVTAQPRNQTRSHQRRLPRPRSAQHHHKFTRTVAPHPIQHIQTSGDLLVAAEKHPGVDLLERRQTRVRRSLTIPLEHVIWIKARRHETKPQPLVPLRLVDGQVDDLTV